MRSSPSGTVCEDVQAQLSAAADGESFPASLVDRARAHREECADCQAFADSLTVVRRGLRLTGDHAVPDVADSVVARLREDGSGRSGTGGHRRSPAGPRLRAAAVVLVGVLIGAAAVGIGGDGPEPVDARPLPEQVRAAQRAVERLELELRMTERGPHPDVPERTYSGRLRYAAPEAMQLDWEDRTDYPSSDWPEHDLRLTTDGETYEVEGVVGCPVALQPGCLGGSNGGPSAVRRSPPTRSFRWSSSLPCAAWPEPARPASSARSRWPAEPASRWTLDAAQIVPLLDGLAPTASLRAVHPADPAVIVLDREHLVPLAATVTAGGGEARDRWAAREGYQDEVGEAVLELTALRFRTDGGDPRRPAGRLTDGQATVDAGFADREEALAAARGPCPDATARIHCASGGSPGGGRGCPGLVVQRWPGVDPG